MTKSKEIWDCIKTTLPKGSWFYLDDIYNQIKNSICLANDDYEPEAPGSNIPKWKRNVRNVLQYRKNSGQILWKAKCKYLVV